MKRKTIYISGQITGLDINDAKAKFQDAVDYVCENMEYEPLNPFDICEQKPEYTWLDYMRADIKALVDCEAIIMLDNWEESDGAKLELIIAQGLKMKIYYILDKN